MYKRYATLNALVEDYHKCPVCNESLNSPAFRLDGGYINSVRCTKGHYLLRFKRYRYAGQRHYLPLQEVLVLGTFCIIKGDRWKNNGNKISISQYSNTTEASTYATLAINGGTPSWYREYTFKEFYSIFPKDVKDLSIKLNRLSLMV